MNILIRSAVKFDSENETIITFTENCCMGEINNNLLTASVEVNGQPSGTGFQLFNLDFDVHPTIITTGVRGSGQYIHHLLNLRPEMEFTSFLESLDCTQNCKTFGNDVLEGYANIASFHDEDTEVMVYTIDGHHDCNLQFSTRFIPGKFSDDDPSTMVQIPRFELSRAVRKVVSIEDLVLGVLFEEV